MSEKPITAQELPQIVRDLDELITRLKTHKATSATATFDELAGLHDTWLDLYQIGDSIRYLAERLDSPYQAQFSGESYLKFGLWAESDDQ